MNFRAYFVGLVIFVIVSNIGIIIFYKLFEKPPSKAIHDIVLPSLETTTALVWKRMVALNESDKYLDEQPQNIAYRSERNLNSDGKYFESSQEIVIVLVSCNGRTEEPYNAIKSAIVFANSPLRIVLFIEEKYVKQFNETLGVWRQKARNKFSFDIYLITYPETEDWHEWKELVVKCASQRLFFPSILRDIEAALFIDCDVLIARPLEEVWHLFTKMNSTQEVAMVTECDLPYGGFYMSQAKHPYFQPGGLNAGVMLMNMTRMRQNLWTRQIVKYYHTYKNVLKSGDQDLINIYLYFHPEVQQVRVGQPGSGIHNNVKATTRILLLVMTDRVLVLNARFNFRPHRTYCDETLGVREAAVIGASILHGTMGGFFTNAPVFQLMFKLWLEYDIGQEPYIYIYMRLRHLMHYANEIKCDNYYHIFLAGMEEQFKL